MSSRFDFNSCSSCFHAHAIMIQVVDIGYQKPIWCWSLFFLRFTPLWIHESTSMKEGWRLGDEVVCWAFKYAFGGSVQMMKIITVVRWTPLFRLFCIAWDVKKVMERRNNQVRRDTGVGAEELLTWNGVGHSWIGFGTLGVCLGLGLRPKLCYQQSHLCVTPPRIGSVAWALGPRPRRIRLWLFTPLVGQDPPV